MNNFVTLRNIQHTSRNRPLKRPKLGSADKSLLCLRKLGQLSWFSTCKFFLTKRLFAEFLFVSDIFRRIQSYFLLFSNEKSHFAWKNLQVENQLQEQVRQQDLCYPNIHRIPHSTLKLWNDAAQTFKCQWPKQISKATWRRYVCSLLFYITFFGDVLLFFLNVQRSYFGRIARFL